MYLALYRRYRPQRFCDVVGQKSAISIIQKAVMNDNIGHAYLFSGPRGCGKTSVARLIAKAVNCTSIQPDSEPCNLCDSCISITNGENLDIIEIDGASNNGVDEVRELKSHVALSPFSERYKVYIIDEVHMLSLAAFNALLKTLEEPPRNVIFILATTEPYKVPVTIRSRCQHIPFHRISEWEILTRLASIASSEGLDWEEEALWEISRQADGALRDALSFMEQTITLDNRAVSLENVTRLLGGASYSELEKLFRLFREDISSAYIFITELFSRGASSVKIVEGLFILSKNLWITCNWGPEYIENLNLSNGEKRFLRDEAPLWNRLNLVSMMDFCVDILPRVRAGMRTDVLSGLIFKNVLSMSLDISQGSMQAQPLRGDEELFPLPASHLHVAKTTYGSAKQSSDEKMEKDLTQSRSEGDQKKEPESFNNNDNRTVDSPMKNQVNINTSNNPIMGQKLSDIDGTEWEQILQILKDHSIAVFSALLSARIIVEGPALVVDFQDSAIAAFKLLCLDRNAYTLLDACSEIIDGKFDIIILRCGKDEKRFSSTERQMEECIYDTPQGGGIEQASLFQSSESPVKEGNKDMEVSDTEMLVYDQYSADRQPNNCIAGDPFKSAVQEILNCTNGELILLKNENLDSYEEEVE